MWKKEQTLVLAERQRRETEGVELTAGSSLPATPTKH